jgi:hypothetical protein
MNNRRIAAMSVTPRCRHRSTGRAPSGGDGVAAARPGDLGDWIERAQVGGETTDYRRVVPQPAGTGPAPAPGRTHRDRASAMASEHRAVRY